MKHVIVALLISSAWINAENVETPSMAIDFNENLNAPAEEEGTLNFEFIDAEVPDVLLEIAKTADINIAFANTLDGRTITLKLHNVTWRQALELSLAPYDHTYISDRNVLKIVPIDELCHEFSVIRIYDLQHRKAEEIAGILTEAMPSHPDRKVVIDAKLNKIIISDYMSRHNDYQAMIAKLDVAPPAEEIVR